MGESRGGEGRKGFSDPTTGGHLVFTDLWEAPFVARLENAEQVIVGCPTCNACATVPVVVLRHALNMPGPIHSSAEKES